MNASILRKPFRYRYYNATLILIVINVIVFMLNEVFNVPRGLLGMNTLYVTKYGMVWQFLTHMFVHGDLTHILFNMLGLFFFGYQVEQRVGSSEFLLYYLLSGFLAGFFSFVVYLATGAGNVLLMGASGAVFAVLLAFATFFPRANIYIMGILPVPAPVLVLGYTAIEIFSQITNPQSGIGHLTHLAGFGFGFLYLLLRLNMNPIKIFIEERR